MIKEGLGWSLVNRITDFKQYLKTEKKWKRELKDIKKQNKMLFIMAKRSGSRHELKSINNVRAKSSKKHGYSISDSSSRDYDSSLSSDIDGD